MASRSLDKSLVRLAFLRRLHLSGNRISDLEKTLSVLRHFRYLEQLDLRGNPIADEPNYRYRVLKCLPSLKILDCHVLRGEGHVEEERQTGRKKHRYVSN
jgi:Leucine-rich repeat (LRR) protein